jgi:DNA-binding response OmpR family regulator
MKVLVVDDDLALADVVTFTLRRAGYDVIVAHDGIAALDRWKNESPDLIILDLNLPKMDGLSVCRQIRVQDSTPIIILSVRGEEDDIVTGLKLGADDYIVKPFSPRQLIARAEAVMRRVSDAPPALEKLTIGDLTLDRSRSQLFYGEELITRLTTLECRLLEVLMLNRDQVVLADNLIDRVWGPSGGDKSMLKQLVYRLRRRMEAHPVKPANIETVPGVGYSLVIAIKNK